MPFAADSIMVKRESPTPSHWLRLADAHRSGMLTLMGTGCQDHVQVVCPPEEIWTIDVRDSLGLISPQNDIAAGISFYNKPGILHELESLDALDHRLRAFAHGQALLNTLFACMRRQAAWVMPHGNDPAAVSREFLGRFCRMLFEDPYSRYFVQRMARLAEPLEQYYTQNLLESCVLSPFQLRPEILDDLHAALHRRESAEPYLFECAKALASQVVTESDRQRGILCCETLYGGVLAVEDMLAKRNPTHETQWQLMHTLYSAAGRPIPAGAASLDVVTQFFPLDHHAVHAFDPNRYLWSYATAYFNGEEAKAAALYDQCFPGGSSKPEHG